MAIGSSNQLNSNIPAGTFKPTDDGEDPSGPAAYPISSPSGTVDFPKQTTTSSSSSGGSDAGGIIGGIGKAIGSIFSLFAQGGPVQHAGDVPHNNHYRRGGSIHEGTMMNEYADGGKVNMASGDIMPEYDTRERMQSRGVGMGDTIDILRDHKREDQMGPEHALGMGYLIGAHHQQKYGGTPKTLTQAAEEIKQALMPHLASGGSVSKSSSTTEAATPTTTSSTKQSSSYDDLTNYYGESNTGDSSSVGGDTSTSDSSSSMPTSTPTTSSIYPSYKDDTSSSSSSSSTSSTDSAAIKPDYVKGSYKAPTESAQGGYMHYAGGGDAQQPLAQGQAFQGDGSVKGPGGPQDDAIPAKLSNGEFVMSAPATQFFGVDKLNKMNEQGKQGFMQMVQQVDQNQQQPPGGQGATPAAAMAGQAPQAPQAMPPQPPAPQMPQQAKEGGVLRTRGSGYCGM